MLTVANKTKKTPKGVEKSKSDKSLVDHINAAEKVLYDLRYVVKFMRSAGEAKKMQEEKRMAKEFEMQEEQRRMEFIKNQSEAEELHKAATTISLLYRKRKARRLVREKKLQVNLENVLNSNTQVQSMWIPFQKLVRQYLTRMFFHKHGIKYNLYRKRKKKRMVKGKEIPNPMSKEELALRINYEVQQRRNMERWGLIHKLIKQYSKLLQTLDANIEYWLAKEASLPKLEEKLIANYRKYNKEHEELGMVVAAQKSLVTPQEYEKLEGTLSIVYIKVEAAEAMVHNCKNRRWWITQIIRANYRRLAFCKVRIIDTLKRIEWNSMESHLVSRIMHHADFRIKYLAEKEDAKLTVDWLKIYLEHATLHQATLDASQQAILLDEMNRIERDITSTNENDSLLQEMMLAIEALSQYSAEKIKLEQQVVVAAKGSEEAVQVNQKFYAIRMKIKQLSNSVIDTVKMGIQEKLTEEDEYHTNIVGFPNDTVDMVIGDMHNIEAVLLEPFIPPPHVKLEHFLDVFFLQPWQAALAVDDVRIEENIRTKEIALDRNQTELKASKSKILEDVDRITELQEEIRTCEQKKAYFDSIIKADGEFASDPEVGGFEEMQLKQIELDGDITRCNIEIGLKKNSILSLKSMQPPMMERINKMVDEITEKKEKFEEQMKERDRVCNEFFKIELEMNHDLFANVAQSAEDHAKRIVDNEKKIRFCEALRDTEQYERIKSGEIGYDERIACGFPLGLKDFEYQEYLNKIRPRTECAGEKYMVFMMEGRMLQYQNCSELFNAIKKNYELEEEIVNGYEKKMYYYQQCVDKYRASMLRQRRQRSLQRELGERKVRIAELRIDRIRMMKQNREDLAAEEEAKRIQDEEDKKRAKENSIGNKLAKATKAALRGGVDLVRSLMHNSAAGMTEEEQNMANYVRRKQKGGGGDGASKQSGVRLVQITKGEEETGLFARKNDHLSSKGLPYFTRMDRSVGEQIYIWYQISFDPTTFITHFELGHKDPNHPKFRHDLKAAGYDMTTHDGVNFVMWTKRDLKRARVLSNFMVSYTEAEEAKAVVEGYDMQELCFTEFGLPESFLWTQKVDRLVADEAVNVNNIINEISKVKQLLKTKPDDKNLQSLYKRLADKLKEGYHKEVLSEVTNPLQYAVELLNLNEADLEQFMVSFSKMDKEGNGKIVVADLLEHIKIAPTNVFREVFHHVDAQNENDEIEFGDFMRACAIYCFFGKDEILKFIYSYADKGHIGRITHDQFIAVLNEMHYYDKTRVRRALKELVMIPGKEMDFHEFRDICCKYPAVPYPMEQYQHVLRESVSVIAICTSYMLHPFTTSSILCIDNG